MKKILLSAATAAFLVVGASSGAMADATADCNAQLGSTLPALPAGFYFVGSYGAESTSTNTSYDNLAQAGKSGNVFGDVTTTTTTTAQLICTAFNSQDKENPGHSATIEVVLSTESETTTGVKVCSQTQPDLAGADVCGAYPDQPVKK